MDSAQGGTVSEELRKLTPPGEMGIDAFLAAAVVPADETRERLLAFMVHEIRNPLASTLWAVEMLARKPLADNRSDRLAQLASRSVRRLRTLLEDLFTLERLPDSPAPGRSELREALQRAMAAHDLEPGGVAGTLEEGGSVIVPVDPVLLDKLLHACMRRMAHAGVDGPISVRMEPGDGYATVEIHREDVSVPEIDPPPLTSFGSEGAGTAFTLLVARALAQRVGVTLMVVPSGTGSVIQLEFPTVEP